MSIDFHSIGAAAGRQLKADVLEVVGSMLSRVGLSIATQQDGAMVTDQHRALNFQGAGVTVTDDATSRRTNINIPGGLTASSDTVVVSSTAAKAKTLWNGTSNDAPPAGWNTVGFNATAWSNAAGGTGAGSTLEGLGYVPTGADELWSQSTTVDGEDALFRQTFTLPSGTIGSAQVEIEVDDSAPGLWVNGTFLWSRPNIVAGNYLPADTVAIPPSLLVAGGSNVIAVWGRNQFTTGGHSAFVAYRIVVSFVIAGVDTRYQLLSEKDAANGYAGLDSGSLVDPAELGTGSPSGSNFLRGDQTWSPASTNSITVDEVDGSPSVAATHLTFPNGSLTNNGGGQVTYAPTVTPGATYLNQLGSDVTLSTLQTDFDGPTITLPAGRYLLHGVVTCSDATSTGYFRARLLEGASVLASSEEFLGVGLYGVSLPVSAVVSPTGSTVYKITVASNCSTSSKIKAATPHVGAGNNASWLLAVPV